MGSPRAGVFVFRDADKEAAGVVGRRPPEVGEHRPRSGNPLRSYIGRVSDLADATCCSALDLPHHMTTQVETKRPTVTVVRKLVFDLRAGDWLIAGHA